MATKTYLEKLKDPRWQKKRLEILNRDEWTCQSCGNNKKTLHIHHQKYSRMPWSVKSEFLITYCEDCHQLLENCIKHGSKNFEFKKIKIGQKAENGQLAVAYGVFKSGTIACCLFAKKDDSEKFSFIMNITEESVQKILTEINHVKKLING